MLGDPRVLHINREIGGTQEEVLAVNPYRKYAIFVNDSVNVIYITLGGEAVVNQGIRINGSGGSYEISALNLWLGRVNAIATGANSKLMVTEW